MDELKREYERAVEAGALDDSPDELRRRLTLALSDIATAAAPRDMGAGREWITRRLEELEHAVRSEICKKDGTGLNDEYAKRLSDALSPQSVGTLASFIVGVAKLVDPTIAVSTVGVYMALWLMKIGLNKWCDTASQTSVRT